MNKYTDIEIKTAKSLLKEGYKWIKKSRLGSILAYEIKPTENPQTFIPGTKVCTAYVSIFDNVKFGDEPVSLEAIVHPNILDDAEKRYLKGVIRPFRDRVKYIEKMYEDHLLGDQDCYLFIRFNDGNSDMNFPVFCESIMYKGMERCRKYTLEELGL